MDLYWILKILAQRALRWLRRFGVLVLVAASTPALAQLPVWSESPASSSWHVTLLNANADGTMVQGSVHFSFTIGTCSVPPLVGDAPALCAFERQLIECGCSEYIAWSESPTATSWHIIRQEVAADGTLGPEFEVGSLTATFRIWRDVDPDPWGETWRGRKHETPRIWFAVDDDPAIVHGKRYRYRLRACNDTGCQTGYGYGKAVDYVGAPWACYVGGEWRPC